MFAFLKKRISVQFFISLVVFVVYSQVSYAANSTFERINKEGVLVVGMSGDQPPFNFVSHLETVMGYDVGLATALAKSLDVEVRFELMPFSELMNALKQQKIDVIISGFAFSEERSEKITFIGPYALSGKSLLLTKKRLKEIRETTGFNHETIHLMALENSTSKMLAETRLSEAKLRTIKHYEQALLALHGGEADALVADLAICELAVIRDVAQELTTLQKPLAVEEVGLAINKNEPLLESHFSALLLSLNKSGELKILHDKWFNSPEWLGLLP